MSTSNEAAPSMSLEEWAALLVEKLELPADTRVDIPLILDLARDAAHSVTRPAAPLTTFLVGYAAGLAGGSTVEIERASSTATDLAAGLSAP